MIRSCSYRYTSLKRPRPIDLAFQMSETMIIYCDNFRPFRFFQRQKFLWKILLKMCAFKEEPIYWWITDVTYMLALRRVYKRKIYNIFYSFDTCNYLNTDNAFFLFATKLFFKFIFSRIKWKQAAITASKLYKEQIERWGGGSSGKT